MLPRRFGPGSGSQSLDVVTAAKRRFGLAGEFPTVTPARFAGSPLVYAGHAAGVAQPSKVRQLTALKKLLDELRFQTVETDNDDLLDVIHVGARLKMGV